MNSAPMNAKFFAEISRKFPSGMTLSQFSHHCVRKARIRVIFSAHEPFRINTTSIAIPDCGSSFANPIGNILFLGSASKMKWITAKRIVAYVHGHLFPFGGSQEQGNPVCLEHTFRDLELSISLRQNSTTPRPAFFRGSLLNLRPKSRSVLDRQCGGYRIRFTHVASFSGSWSGLWRQLIAAFTPDLFTLTPQMEQA